MFVDIAQIELKAGDGGNGRVSFRREKYAPNGGPDGGDGGKGASIIFVADESMRTLMDFRYKRKYQAENGEDGGKKNKTGKSAEDLYIRVPVGTIIKEKNSGLVMCDMKENKQTYIACKGGRGGRGNQHFATPTRQAPTFAEKGTKGDAYDVLLELKMIADVGLMGYPNVGKSTFLARTTKATPKIANYHFTTLTPNLGVVEHIKGKSFVLADIPGIIEGASMGVGLGFEFLRHIERTKVLIHVLDASGSEGRNPLKDFEDICNEAFSFGEIIKQKEMVVAANKLDLVSDKALISELIQNIEKKGYKVFPISAATGEGIDDLLDYVTTLVDTLPNISIINDEEYFVPTDNHSLEKDIVYFKENDIYCVEGDYIDRLLYSTDLSDVESLCRFENALKQSGVFDTLREMGCEDGDTVRIFDFEFEFYD